MNPLILQEELIEELKSMFAGLRFNNPIGKSVGINIFAQNTPLPQSDEETEPIPYIIVHLNDGEQKVRGDSFNIVGVTLIIGLFNSDNANQGHKEVMNIIYEIQDRFSKKPALKKTSFAGDFKWGLMDTETYPYYWGTCEMDFYIPSIRREDKLS